MLILTRRVKERIMIGDDINIEVLGMSGSQIRIGINAPDNVSIHREEVYNRIKEESMEEKMEEKNENELL